MLSFSKTEQNIDTTNLPEKDVKPIVAYRAGNTPIENLDVSMSDSLGIHFGTIDQAKHIMKYRGEKAKILPAQLLMKNPLRVKEDKWYFMEDFVTQFENNPKIPSDDLQRLKNKLSELKDASKTFQDYLRPQQAEVRKFLLEHGFDGLVYENLYEGKGETYVAIDNATIKPG